MKGRIDRGDILRAFAAAAKGSGPTRLFLLYGPDEAASRALAAELGATMGGDAERIDLTGTALKADPARLADEAASLALFGGPRYVRVEPAGDEAADAVVALIEAPAAGNPVIVVAGALRKDAKLVKLAAPPAGIALQSYLPDARTADRLVAELGREAGLDIRRDVAARIAAAAGNDRGVIAQELAKFALFLDAAPERPRALDGDTLDALGGDIDEGDLGRLVDAVLGGDPAAAEHELARLGEAGIEGVPVLRAIGRRLQLLGQLGVEVAGGSDPDMVVERAGRAIFYKDKAAIARQLGRWSPDRLSRAVTMLGEAERAIKRRGPVGLLETSYRLVTAARASQRVR